jgi:hypothetical protein
MVGDFTSSGLARNLGVCGHGGALCCRGNVRSIRPFTNRVEDFLAIERRLCMLEIYQRHLTSEMKKADEVVPASATNQKPEAFCDGSGVAGRRISRRRFGD